MHQPEDALNYSRPILMTGKKSPTEHEQECSRRIVIQSSLTVWDALLKAAEKFKATSYIVVGAKTLSEAWKILTSIVDDGDDERAKEQAKKEFEELSMNCIESMKEYIARAKSLALNIQYHGIEVTVQETSRRGSNGLPSAYAPQKRNFVLKPDFSLRDLEGGLVRVEELSRSLYGIDGSHALVLVSKPKVATRVGKAGAVEAVVAAAVASATVKVARRIIISSKSSGVGERSPRSSSGSSITRNVNGSNSNITAAPARAVRAAAAAALLSAILAVTSVTAARTALRRMGSITRLFKV